MTNGAILKRNKLGKVAYEAAVDVINRNPTMTTHALADLLLKMGVRKKQGGSITPENIYVIRYKLQKKQSNQSTNSVFLGSRPAPSTESNETVVREVLNLTATWEQKKLILKELLK
jgi:hypothetical protein